MKQQSNVELFFIAIVPDEPVQGEIMALKNEVYEKFGSKGALRSPAHITLHMPFKWKVSKMELLEKSLQLTALECDSFLQQLDGFDAFDQRVIFVDVMENPILRELHSKVSRCMRTKLNMMNADYKAKGFHPHVTIAFRDLKKSVFKEAWPEFEFRKYNASFNVGSFELLKHNGSGWEVYRRFPFGDD
ncbi:2'-5' RNA ligase family protein [Aureibacter tunicatorum]|uniref:2'-5' RNA ligase n=1 Tax=Aureibacter tunicatorum TaxID=866807 RepID=A0AAE4BQ14_9BACT|nr:2'-5' RNA ligase family protein [Aureibacter tunicatorum]MDR6237086.1 2'-5' RNA ligase [Aureibacter tunicatorum]BDD06078.1 hypothetical protein AUTU_35610 [Aureibacter tunicatorum]